MQGNIDGRRNLQEAREEVFSFQRKVIFNWRVLKEYLQPVEAIDAFISEDLVEQDLWDCIKNDSHRSQVESILCNVIKHIQTMADLIKFEAIVADKCRYIELKTPTDDGTPIKREEELYLRANIEFIEKEVYPKDYIDNFLEWFILSLEDHESLRNNANVRQKMGHIFMEKIMKAANVDKGSIQRLFWSFQNDKNKILRCLSNRNVRNGNSNILGDKDFQQMIDSRDVYRKAILCKLTFLKEEFSPFYIVDDLFASGLVDEDRCDIIREKPRRKQVDLTVRNIVRRVDQRKTFMKLINILEKEDKSIAVQLNAISNKRSRGAELNYIFREVSESDVIFSKARLKALKRDIIEEFDLEDIDTFLELDIFDVDDHETICEAGNSGKDKALCFYEHISNRKFMKKGSFGCLEFCLKNNGTRKKTRKMLAELLVSSEMPKQAKNRTALTLKMTDGNIYKYETCKCCAFNEGKVIIAVEDEEIKDRVEHALYTVVGSTEYEDKEIEGFKMKITDTTTSSVVVHLKSDDRNARFIVENGIVNGDLTRFIGNLFDNESIKMHLSLEKKYRVSVSFQSTTYRRCFDNEYFRSCICERLKMQVIKANRALLEEEYDPLPLLHAVFDENVRNYHSVQILSPEQCEYFKRKFSTTINVTERRKRVEKFLDIAENNFEADQLWGFIKDTANALIIRKMELDIKGHNTGPEGINLSDVITRDGKVFEGVYEVFITEEDVKSPLQSKIIEEREKEERRRKRRREAELNEEVKFWKKVRKETLPRLDELKEELKRADKKIQKARLVRRAAVVGTLFGGLLFSIFTGGMSAAGALTFTLAGGVASVTFIIETFVEKDVLKRTEQGINQDKQATINFITRVRAYSGTDPIPFAKNLQRIRLDGIQGLAIHPLINLLFGLIDLQNPSLLNAIEKITDFTDILEKELQKVDRVQGQYLFR